MKRWLMAMVPLIATAALPVPVMGRSMALPDSFAAGPDANGEPCTASRSWTDPRLATPFDRSLALTCRGVDASRRQGAAFALHRAPRPADMALCGAAKMQAMRSVGPVETQLCSDPSRGEPVVTIRFRRGSYHYIGIAVSEALAPLEVALEVLAGRATPPASTAQAGVGAVASIDVKNLSQPPGGIPALSDHGDATQLEPDVALSAGITRNRRGLYIDASRLLNETLSRLPANTPPLTRAELLLEAGLADSNITQFDAASDDFARAAKLISSSEDLNRGALLQAKLSTYRGLDLINRNGSAEALIALGVSPAADEPLRDPAVLSVLNQSPRRGIVASLSTADDAQLSRLFIEAQRNWARSVAYLGLRQIAESRTALNQSLPYVDELQRNINPDAAAALKARVQRQFGRINARDGRLVEALASFDCAVATLQGIHPASGKQCLFDEAASSHGRGEIGSADGPLIAETQLERASLLSHIPGTSDAVVLRQFDTAIDSLIGSGVVGGTVQPSLEAYLDLLARLSAEAPSADLDERYFRAVQAVGEPAIARQVAQLKRIVTADGGLGAKARDRGELERQITRLIYKITATDPTNTAELARLNVERQQADLQLDAVKSALAASGRFTKVDDQPVSVAAVRAALRPGEWYLKVTRLRTRAFAIAIGRDRSFVYALEAPAAAVDSIARRVRASIRNDSGLLPFFDVAASYALFHLIAGPAETELARAAALVVDPSGPLENLPAGVLVTRLDSVRAYSTTRRTKPNDYSAVAFLGAHAELSNALSAQSFLITRQLPASRAAQPFIGFGENALARLGAVPADARVAFGSGCDIAYSELVKKMNNNQPVSAHELTVASAALGAPDAPQVVRDDFTDVAILDHSRHGDYRKFQVLHFATHGVPETPDGQCTRIPPSLVTTLAPPGAVAGLESDGLLSMTEVAQLDLDANLVVLSACETASGVSGAGGRLAGQDESAATLDGLVRAFITANARAVVATYWQVPASVQTETLIGSFYRAGRSETIGAALRDAQRGAIAQPAVSHPYFWGAYFLVGDGSKTMLSRLPAVAATDPR